MKIWNGYGSEHSANLVLIGNFKSADEAQKSLDLLNEATSIAMADEEAGRISANAIPDYFTDAQMELFLRTQLSFGYGDPVQLLMEFAARREGDQVIITTNETDIAPFIKVLLHCGAHLQVYSAHDHGGPYGRQTNPDARPPKIVSD